MNNKEYIKTEGLKIRCANNTNNISVLRKILYIRQEETKKVKEKGKLGLKKIVLIVLGGAIVGFLNGFFGGGGGMVCVPLLEKIMKLEGKQAHATAIAIILPLSIVSAAVYVYNGFVNTNALIFVSLGVIFGGIIGAFFLKILPSKLIKIIFLIIMFIGGIKLIIWVVFYYIFYTFYSA